MLGLITLSVFTAYILAAYLIVKVQKNKRRKIIAATIMILIPTWDVIIGRAVFYTLCATQSGIHVYQTVKLGPEYFDKDGVPLFYDGGKMFRDMSMAGQYFGVTNSKVDVSKLFNIRLSVDSIVDKERKATLGDIKYFIYYGGWVFNALNTGGSGGSGCQKPSSKPTIELTKKIFLINKQYK